MLCVFVKSKSEKENHKLVHPVFFSFDGILHYTKYTP